MPREKESDRSKAWQDRVASANKAFKKWADKYCCNQLEQYYYGHQWQETEGEQKPYQVNLFYSTVNTLLPTLLYYYPQIKLNPQPGRSDEPASEVAERCKLQEETVNTIINDRRMHFKPECHMAILEAMFRFGVVEVGYSNDFVDNPNANRPIVVDGVELADGSGNKVLEPKRIPNPDNPSPEEIYIRRIPAKQFRVSVNNRTELTQCDWCGYWEYVYPADLKANPNYKNTTNLPQGGKLAKEYSPIEYEQDADGNDSNRDMCLVWKVWDMRARMKRVFVMGHDKFLLEEPYKRIPFAVLRMYHLLDSFYPLPVAFNWLSPQDELNDIRETQRVHRKRFYRRYTYRDGAIDESELRKLEDGGDGVYAKSNQPNPLEPVPDAPLDPAIVRNIPEAKSDFMQVSGIGDEQRGSAEPNTTATQASIVDMRSRVRESYVRMQVSEWLAKICTLILETIRDEMALPFWIKSNVDPFQDNAVEEAIRVAGLWKQITAKELGDRIYEVTVDVQSLTPLTDQTEAAGWIQAIQLLGGPAGPYLAASPQLLQKTLGIFGIKEQRTVEEIRRVMSQVMIGQMMAQAAAAGAPMPQAGMQAAPPGDMAAGMLEPPTGGLPQ